MCAIFGLVNFYKGVEGLRTKAIKMSSLMRHRGPDDTGVYEDEHAILIHERLSIIDLNTGRQPLVTDQGNLVLIANGEIYNYQEIIDKYNFEPVLKTSSDCEVILHLYKEIGERVVHELRGMYAFCVYNKQNSELFIARDHVGIVPLYYGVQKDGSFVFSSELKSLEYMSASYERSAPMGRARQRCCLNRLLDPASPQCRCRLTARPAARWDMPHRRVDTRIK